MSKTRETEVHVQRIDALVQILPACRLALARAFSERLVLLQAGAYPF